MIRTLTYCVCGIIGLFIGVSAGLMIPASREPEWTGISLAGRRPDPGEPYSAASEVCIPDIELGLRADGVVVWRERTGTRAHTPVTIAAVLPDNPTAPALRRLYMDHAVTPSAPHQVITAEPERR